jgi:hypothetical protein
MLSCNRGSYSWFYYTAKQECASRIVTTGGIKNLHTVGVHIMLLHNAPILRPARAVIVIVQSSCYVEYANKYSECFFDISVIRGVCGRGFGGAHITILLEKTVRH